jgi:hypothetical protein
LNNLEIKIFPENGIGEDNGKIATRGASRMQGGSRVGEWGSFILRDWPAPHKKYPNPQETSLMRESGAIPRLNNR